MSFRPLYLTRPQAECLINIERSGQCGVAFFEQDLPRHDVLARLGLIEVERSAQRGCHMAALLPKGIAWARFFLKFGFIPATQQRLLFRLDELRRADPGNGEIRSNGDEVVFVYRRLCRSVSRMALQHLLNAGLATLRKDKGCVPQLRIFRALLDGLWELDLELTCLEEAPEDLASQDHRR